MELMFSLSSLPPPPQHHHYPTPLHSPTHTHPHTHAFNPQIENTTDLFNFDEEVTPMLEIMIIKTLEQALFEINTEEEMRALGNEIMIYETNNQLEQEWMKEQELNLINSLVLKETEINLIKLQNNELLRTKTKVGALQFMSQIMDKILIDISSELLENGIWTDPLSETVKETVSEILRNNAIMVESYCSAEEVC